MSFTDDNLKDLKACKWEIGLIGDALRDLVTRLEADEKALYWYYENHNRKNPYEEEQRKAAGK